MGAGLPVDSPLPKDRAQEALRIAEGSGDWLTARHAHRELAWLAMHDGDHAAMRHHAGAQLDIDRRLGDIAHEPRAIAQFGYAAMLAGDFDESVRMGEEAASQARRRDQRRTLAISLGQLALVRIYRGEMDTAEEHLAEAREVFPQLLTDSRGSAVILDWPEAVLALERGEAIGADKAHLAGLSWGRMLLGAAHVVEGDLDGAMATRAVLAAASPGSLAVALADRLQGLIKLAQGETDAARSHFERSAAAFDDLELPFEAAVSRLHAGTVERVRQSLTTFEAVGAARYADKARKTLRSLGVRLPSPRSGRGTDQPLSRREMEVARLVAEGLTNAEIAERLILSVRTVESHLDHVYSRLGISSRAALARWVTAGQAASFP